MIAANKILGVTLLTVGLLMIFWSVYSSYLIFTGGKEAPQIFSYIKDKNILPSSVEDKAASDKRAVEVDKYESAPEANLLETQQEQIDQIKDMLGEQMKKQLNGIIPPEFFAKITNLSSWSIFVFIVISAGSKISALGVKLMKN